MNRSRPPLVPLAFGLALSATALGFFPACNARVGNEQGHSAVGAAGSGGASAGSGASAGAGTTTVGGQSSGGTSVSGGSPSGGGSTDQGGATVGGGTNSGGTNSGGTNSGGTNSGGTNSGGTNSGGTNSGGANGGGANGGGANSGGTNSGGMAGGGGGGTVGGAGGGTTGPYCAGPITPCGGSLIGTWTVQSECHSVPVPGLTTPAACDGYDTLQSFTFTDSTFTYQAGALQETIVETVKESLVYTTACIAALHQLDSTTPAPPASTITCQGFSAGLTDPGTQANCTFVAATKTCDCSTSTIIRRTINDTYSLKGATQYYTGGDTTRSYPISYCVKGTTLTISQTDAVGRTVEYVFSKN